MCYDFLKPCLFQKNISFKSLGLVIIDEQHKFGVKQRIELSNKGGKDCDILLMSATPIPRTLALTVYGDMDVSRLIEKPMNRKEIITLRKLREKPLKLEELSAKFNISRERVRQIEEKALKKLQKEVSNIS